MVQMKNHWINKGWKKPIRPERRVRLHKKKILICLVIFREQFPPNLFLKRWRKRNLKWILMKLLRRVSKTLNCQTMIWPNKKKKTWQPKLQLKSKKIQKQLQLKPQNKQLNKLGTKELMTKSYKKKSAKKTTLLKIMKKL